ncbi:MAG: nucleotide exchange factor GrpE [Streptosporangiaceae bacterium]|jgi:molecular chaperone GrpE
MTTPDDMGNGPVIRDHRRIDPVTGQVRRGKHAASQPAGTQGAGRPGGAGASGGRHGRRAGAPEDTPDEVMETEAQNDAATAAEEAKTAETGNLEIALAERTADLQRLQAEYQNYRKRVERDRVAVKEAAFAAVLSELLPVLDAIGQAREHGELSGGFKSVADSLQATVSKLGLVTYGEKGEAFDPKVHEALTHMYSPDVTEVTCFDILQPGYRVGDRILRPARVAVAEPAGDGDDNND